jgi:uncharacterized protein YbaP (TraB family)
MKWLAAVAALMFACRGHEGAPRAGSAHVEARGSAGSGSAVAGSAVAAPDPWAVDPWAGSAAGSAGDGAPTLMDRHRFAEAACPSVTGPYFFRIEKAGKTSYILGTRHVSVPLAKFPQVVRDQIDAARLAVFEVAPDDDAKIDRPDIDIERALGSADWNHYVDLVGSATARAVKESRPATAAILMMVEYEDPGSLLDLEIEHEVAARHIPAAGLETSAFQDEMLDRLFDLRALKAQIEQTKDRHELEQDSHDDLAEYCAGTDTSPGTDEKNRKQMLASGYTNAEIDHIDDLMVFQRNARWIPQLEKLFGDGDVFVAVGADHLIGDKGVIALLRKRGFTATRVIQ